mmetsp:Transcript_50954/g.114587  ORF Transcript_50954/g.114587 Transcript_50954/m.114587 type:complete len:229 (+) Transcript_50954:416-1102(+)
MRDMPSIREFLCTKTSSPPPSGTRKPKPLSSYQAFTEPLVKEPSVTGGAAKPPPRAAMAAPPSTPGKPPPQPPGQPPLPPPLGTAPMHRVTAYLFLSAFQEYSKCTWVPGTRHCPSSRTHLCTKTSSTPALGVMKPKPFSSIQFLTMPGCRPAGTGKPPPPPAAAADMSNVWPARLPPLAMSGAPLPHPAPPFPPPFAVAPTSRVTANLFLLSFHADSYVTVEPMSRA